MNISCDMAMDLIPLYNDGVLSEDSRLAVREHIKGCPKCARSLALCSAKRRSTAAKISGGYVGDISSQYKKLAQHLRMKHVISTAAVVAIVAVSVAVGSYSTMKLLAAGSSTEPAEND